MLVRHDKIWQFTVVLIAFRTIQHSERKFVAKSVWSAHISSAFKSKNVKRDRYSNRVSVFLCCQIDFSHSWHIEVTKQTLLDGNSK